MPSLLPPPRSLTPPEREEHQAVQEAARVAGKVLDTLFASATAMSQRIDDAVGLHPLVRDALRGQAMDAEECLARGHQLLREGYILVEQSIQRRPGGI